MECFVSIHGEPFNIHSKRGIYVKEVIGPIFFEDAFNKYALLHWQYGACYCRTLQGHNKTLFTVGIRGAGLGEFLVSTSPCNRMSSTSHHAYCAGSRFSGHVIFCSGDLAWPSWSPDLSSTSLRQSPPLKRISDRNVNSYHR